MSDREKISKEEESGRLAAFVREHPDPVLECDPEGATLYANPAARELLWRISSDLEDVLPEDHREVISSCLAAGKSRISERLVDGRMLRWLYHPLDTPGRVHLYASDITDQHRAEQELAHAALHDGLTGLPNRALLIDRIERALDVARRRDDFSLAVMLLDLDYFETITESLGGSVGDTVLQRTARRLVEELDEGDTVAHLEGDRFAALLIDVKTAANAARTAQAALDAVRRPLEIADRSVEVTASAGVALGPRGSKRAEELLRDADAAMYRAKGLGRSRFQLFDIELQRRAAEVIRGQSELRRALERRELELHFQPIFSLADRSLEGFEALARWQHPQRGLLGPSEFIPLAEETGMIEVLGDFTFSAACDQIVEWERGGLPPKSVSVNLSDAQLEQADLLESIRRAVAGSGADISRLSLEIPESAVNENPEQSRKVVTALERMGIGIVLDDFGTGCSSLRQLESFPFDVVKLDRSFVRNLPDDPSDAAIAAAVIEMTHALGRAVVAEGVERERQIDFLVERGCDRVQGFYFGRPMPPRRAAELLVEAKK
ncbi:MAG: EAL domain-containing protein [Polyangia bacterium]